MNFFQRHMTLKEHIVLFFGGVLHGAALLPERRRKQCDRLACDLF